MGLFGVDVNVLVTPSEGVRMAGEVTDWEEQEGEALSLGPGPDPDPDCRPWEVVLRGGAPWGFDLEGGDGEGDYPLHVSQIEAEGGAEGGGVRAGDVVMGVNGVSCGRLEVAQLLVDTAFRTLTLRLLRF
ncbi:hypothetical protein ACOMHN_048748 [Nucella lapillus]